MDSVVKGNEKVKEVKESRLKMFLEVGSAYRE